LCGNVGCQKAGGIIGWATHHDPSFSTHRLLSDGASQRSRPHQCTHHLHRLGLNPIAHPNLNGIIDGLQRPPPHSHPPSPSHPHAPALRLKYAHMEPHPTSKLQWCLPTGRPHTPSPQLKRNRLTRGGRRSGVNPTFTTRPG